MIATRTAYEAAQGKGGTKGDGEVFPTSHPLCGSSPEGRALCKQRDTQSRAAVALLSLSLPFQGEQAEKASVTRFRAAKCPTQVSKQKGHGVAFFRSDTPRIGRNEASAVPSAHFDHIRGEVRLKAQSVIATRTAYEAAQGKGGTEGDGEVFPNLSPALRELSQRESLVIAKTLCDPVPLWRCSE